MSSRMSLFAVAFIVRAVAASAQGYPVAEIHNNSPYPVSGTVAYASAFCTNDRYSVGPKQVWRASARGVCLITSITGGIAAGTRSLHGEVTQVTTYTTSGTAYAVFRIEAFGDRYRIFSLNEYAANSRTDSRSSPGFRFINETDWPIAFSLDQVGCLYHDVLPSRDPSGNPGIMVRSTGAVWFTLRMHIQPDGVNPQTDWDCVEPVVELIGDVALAAMTGGAGVALAAPKIAAKQVAKAAIKAALKKSIKELAKNGAKQIGQYLVETGSISMGGQYAGYDWPFRCDAMPEYRITGGPGVMRTEDGEWYLIPGPPFTVTKTNACGNDMMLASPRTATAKVDVPGFFSTDDPDPVQPPTPTPTPNPVQPPTPVLPNDPVRPVLGGLASDGVSGRNVTQAEHNGGSFRRSGDGQWREYTTQGVAMFVFEEAARDDKSVYLIDRSRNIVIELDINRRVVSYGPVGQARQDLYSITNAYRPAGSPVASPAGVPGVAPALSETGVNGRNLVQAFHAGGSFRQTGPGQWAEYNPQGVVTYSFAETGRDDWSVYLVDRSRNMEIQLDIYRKMISFAVVGQPRQDLYQITRSLRP